MGSRLSGEAQLSCRAADRELAAVCYAPHASMHRMGQPGAGALSRPVPSCPHACNLRQNSGAEETTSPLSCSRYSLGRESLDNPAICDAAASLLVAADPPQLIREEKRSAVFHSTAANGQAQQIADLIERGSQIATKPNGEKPLHISAIIRPTVSGGTRWSRQETDPTY